jgi:multicomponent Na+:H+ antiporter subunit F
MTPFVQNVTTLSLVFLAFSLVLMLIRIVRGPSIADRVIALDLGGILIAGTIGIWAVRSNTPALLDVAVVLAIIVFLSTVAFARYQERRALDE